MEYITEIINEWDPIDLFPLAPKDEYTNEIKRIYEYVYYNQNIQIRALAEAINGIFVKAFGTDVYDENIKQCMQVAEKILKQKCKSRI